VNLKSFEWVVLSRLAVERDEVVGILSSGLATSVAMELRRTLQTSQ